MTINTYYVDPEFMIGVNLINKGNLVYSRANHVYTDKFYKPLFWFRGGGGPQNRYFQPILIITDFCMITILSLYNSLVQGEAE